MRQPSRFHHGGCSREASFEWIGSAEAGDAGLRPRNRRPGLTCRRKANRLGEFGPLPYRPCQRVREGEQTHGGPKGGSSRRTSVLEGQKSPRAGRRESEVPEVNTIGVGFYLLPAPPRETEISRRPARPSIMRAQPVPRFRFKTWRRFPMPASSSAGHIKIYACLDLP